MLFRLPCLTAYRIAIESLYFVGGLSLIFSEEYSFFLKSRRISASEYTRARIIFHVEPQ